MTPLEEKVWEKLQSCGEYNFNKETGVKFDPKNIGGLTAEQLADRTLSPNFLGEILLQAACRQKLHRKGVRIIGAWIKEGLDLEDAHLTHEFRLQESRIEGPATLEGVRLTRLKNPECISFHGSSFAGGVSFSGARIDGTLDLSDISCERLVMEGAVVGEDLVMNDMRCVSDINAEGIVVRKSLTIKIPEINTILKLDHASIDGDVRIGAGTRVTCKGPISITSARIGGDLIIQDLALRGGVEVTHAGSKVCGKVTISNVYGPGSILFERFSGRDFEVIDAEFAYLSLFGANFTGKVDIQSTRLDRLSLEALQVTGDFKLARTPDPRKHIREVTLSKAKVEGSVTMSKADFDALQADKLEVSCDLTIENFKSESTIALGGAKVGRDFKMRQAECRCPLQMEELEVGRNTSIEDISFANCVSLHGSRVGGDLTLRKVKSGYEKSQLDLSDVTIDGTLHVGIQVVDLIEDSIENLDLSHAKADVFEIPSDSIKKTVIDLEGFRYNWIRLGTSKPLELRDVCLAWLKNEKHSPETFRQMATVLQNMGYPAEANSVLFEDMKLRRRRAWNKGQYWRFFWLLASELTIGYGIGRNYLRAVFWVAVFTVLGAYVFSTTDYAIGKHVTVLSGQALTFGFERLMPFSFDLGREYAAGQTKIFEAPDKLWQYCYLAYVQRIIGLGLASFVAAGLSGLTKK